MIYSEREICYEYKTAKHKSKQIGVLADLNMCKPNDIKEILMKNNLLERNEEMKKFKWTAELDASVARFADEGLTARQIAERIGVTEQQIYNRRSYFMKEARKQSTQPTAAKQEAETIEESQASADAKPTESNTYSLDIITSLLNSFGIELDNCNIDFKNKQFSANGTLKGFHVSLCFSKGIKNPDECGHTTSGTPVEKCEESFF